MAVLNVVNSTLLTHKQKKNRRSHEKRRLLRQKTACTREEQILLSNAEEIENEETSDLERAAAERAWLKREEVARDLFKEKRLEEEKRQKEKDELKQRIQEEFKELQEKEEILAPNLSKIKFIDSQSRQEMLKQFDNLIEEAKEEEYSNPLAPSSYPQYGTELDVKYCSFYLKTGACRFGERCSRYHMKPPSSNTILLPAMFQHISLGEDFNLDTDSGLEHEESDTNRVFTEFFWEVFPEFQGMGQVIMFKVCCNHEPHLRGNAYVQYQKESEAVKAYAKFNGRFYAGRQISCEFIKIEKWKSAICGQFHRMKCPKGKHCNFLHVFKNPGGLFMVHGSEVLNYRSPVVQACRARYQASNPVYSHHPRPPSMTWSPRWTSQGRGAHSPSHNQGRGAHSPSHNRGRGAHSPFPDQSHVRGTRTSPLHRSRGSHSQSLSDEARSHNPERKYRKYSGYRSNHDNEFRSRKGSRWSHGRRS